MVMRAGKHGSIRFRTKRSEAGALYPCWHPDTYVFPKNELLLAVTKGCLMEFRGAYYPLT